MVNESNPNSVGITLVTGFLGSGKSTLIRRILTEDHGLRIVVVENEFGDTAVIEQAIVTQGVGPSALEEFIELPNGCICCQAQDDLVDSLTRLVEKKKGKFDHILVEASGLADPRPVAASFWVDAVADASLRLDSVVAIVDASQVDMDNMLARMQVAVADTVLLNKLDLVGSDARGLIEQQLRENGCIGRIIPTVKCDVDIQSLLNIRAYDSDMAISNLPGGANELPTKFLNHFHDDEHQHLNQNGSSGKTDTFTISFQGMKFDEALLNRALGHLLWDQPDADSYLPTDSGNMSASSCDQTQQIWRMKALVVMDDEEFKWIFQSVHTLFDDMVSSVKADDGKSLFLFIGQGMNRDVVQQRLDMAIKRKDNLEGNTTFN